MLFAECQREIQKQINDEFSDGGAELAFHMTRLGLRLLGCRVPVAGFHTTLCRFLAAASTIIPYSRRSRESCRS